MGLRKNLREDLPLEERRRGFARIASMALWLFTIGSAIGAFQVGRALWSRRIWVNYRGEVITAAQMWRELIFFALVAVACALMAWYWHRVSRRRF